MHILVVDDDMVNRQIAQMVLQKAGHRVDLAENGQQAVNFCKADGYDLILMDIQMPVMGGLEATRKIRRLESAAAEDVPNESGLPDKIAGSSDSVSAIRLPTSAFRRVPIIAMTGDAVAGCFDESQYPGMNACIGKPLHRKRLLDAVLKYSDSAFGSRFVKRSAIHSRPTAKRQQRIQPPLDLTRAIREFMGQKKLLFGVLTEFTKITAFRIETLQGAVKSNDFDVIASEAHALKGGAANLTADKLAALASGLEKAAIAHDAEMTGLLLDKLTRELDYWKDYLRASGIEVEDDHEDISP